MIDEVCNEEGEKSAFIASVYIVPKTNSAFVLYIN